MIFLFELSLASHKKLFLTSASEAITNGQHNYQPYSGLFVESIHKENGLIDCIISGFFEENGVANSSILESSRIRITYLENPNLACKTFSSLEFFTINHNNYSFKVTYTSIIHNLKRPIIDEMNPSCRANLGDKDCRIDLQQFIEQTKLLSIDKNKIIIYKSMRPPGYFNDGFVRFENNLTSKILIFSQTEFFIETEVEVKIGTKLILYPSCNKSFKQCVDRFTNGINFRGEPFIGR